jgi:hypothetical protein
VVTKADLAGGAYVATPVVAMYAPIVGSSTCRRATIKAHGMQIVAWYTPTTPKGAYMPTTTVGTYAPPVKLVRAFWARAAISPGPSTARSHSRGQARENHIVSVPSQLSFVLCYTARDFEVVRLLEEISSCCLLPA